MRFLDGRSLLETAVKAAAKDLKARSRITFLKITGTGKLTAGQLPGRKSLGSSLPMRPQPSFVNSFVISSIELVPRAHFAARELRGLHKSF